MAEPVRARRLSDEEGRRLQQIVRRGRHGSIRVRRAMMIMASASGTPVPAIARLVAADGDTVRDVIHAFNARGLAALDPRWAGGRPRLIGDEDIQFIVAAAATRPEKLGLPFTHWSVRKLAACLGGAAPRPVAIGRERLRQILRERGISFQRTRTWKESADPDRDAKLDRIEYVTTHFPGRCFAFGQFGPLSIRPCHGSAWAREKRPVRLPAACRRTHGIRYFHGCYCLADDQLWGVTRRRKGGDHTLAALKSIRAAQPGGYRLYVILDYVPRDIIQVLCPAALCAAGRANRGGGPARGRGEGRGGAGLGHIILQSDESQLSSAWSERQTGVVRDPAEVPGSSVARRAASLVRVLISA
jgi:transposase